MNVVLADPAVAAVGASIGASPFNAAVNFGRLFISLKPISQRGGLSTQRVIARMRPKLAEIPGISVFMYRVSRPACRWPAEPLQYQFTLWSADIDELNKWVPRAVDRVKQVPGVVDVTTDRDFGGLQVNVIIDRLAAARLGVRVQDIDNSLNNSFSQRQISTIYGPRNQYRVILEVDRKYQRDPSDLKSRLCHRQRGYQVPLSAVTRRRTGQHADLRSTIRANSRP